ncbi:MAG: hypothetical protein DHS20C17_15450 [Cyclobacteriaceae bacterium]|nr:MAG: hypothetical protein DHS20C17_15450 [Cyclobacteriaceae bacterium]
MWYTRLFQLLGLSFIFLFNSCWQKDLSKNTADDATEYELAVWSDTDEENIERQPNIWDITQRHNSFNTFSLLMEVAGLEETLKADQEITVLAPTEEAFSLLGEGSIVELLKEDNRIILEELLLSHIIPEVYHSVDLLDGETRTTLSGRRLTIQRNANIKLSNATVTTADIAASNGVVHVVDQVVLAK